MTTYTRVNEGDPIIPFDIFVDTPINVRASYPNDVYSELDPQGPEWLPFWQGYADQFEEEIKNQNFFLVKDLARNASFEIVPDDTRTELNGKLPYKITVNFTIENAVVRQSARIESELTGAELDAYILAYANDLGQRFLDERNWIRL